MEKDIKSRAAKSVVWSFAEKLSVQGIGFIISLYTCALLSTGRLWGYCNTHIFISVATVFIDGGFSNALIQNQKRTEKDFLLLSIQISAWHVFCYLILFFCSTISCWFFSTTVTERCNENLWYLFDYFLFCACSNPDFISTTISEL